MTPTNERGIALVLSLFLMMAMSVVAASLMFLSQTETYSSMNYTVMSQARYGAESGLQKAVNFLLNNYAAPAAGTGDPLTAYDMTKSPVTFNGQPVVLSANAAKASNYPVAAVQTAFSAAAQGTMASGMTTVTYAPYATLVSMASINVYGGGVQTIQTWQITSLGTIGAGRTAQVEVSGSLETGKAPATMYAAFATDPNCGAQQYAGGATTDSYGALDATGHPIIDLSGGNVGTNGNLTESGGAVIHGTLATPRVGVGGCSNGNVDALTSQGGATVDGGVIQLPQAITLTPPAAPNPLPPTGSVTYNSNTTLTPGSYADIKVTGNSTLTLTAGTYTVNSLDVASGSTILIQSTPVIFNVAGVGVTTAVSFTGTSTLVNTTYDASAFVINYGGTAAIKLTGGTSYCAMIYAPQADITFAGGDSFYGAVVGKTVKDTGGAHLHFDRNLEDKFFVVGNGMLSGFSWKKY
jgi:PilX N-terminal